MRPEHTYPNKLEEWERNVFLNASHFTVFIPRVGKWDDIPTFIEALGHAAGSPRAIVYAVTESGRSCMCVRKKWSEYRDLWLEKRK